MTKTEVEMKHQTRRSLRIVLTLIHVIAQLLLMGYIYLKLGTIQLSDRGTEIQMLIKIMIHIGLIIGVFTIYYSIMKLLSRRNIPD